MKIYTFGKNNNSNFFHTSSKPNYSKTLDDIIIADVTKKNSYLFNNTNFTPENDIDSILLGTTNSYSDLDKAILFLANYKKYKNTYKIPYALNKMYTLSDGTPIIFYDDEIQIGFDTYSYSDFNNIDFINALTPKKKKIIINIFNASGADININLI